jgi:hypothetical protein
MSYWVGARLGVRHCSLCDITHSLFTQKAIWIELRDKLMKDYGVDFQAFHRNDQPDNVREVIKNQYPAVVAQDEIGQLFVFMTDAEISQCDKSPERFVNHIIERLPQGNKN